MRDERLGRLARQLVNRSVALQKGEHLLVSSTGAENPLVVEIIRCAYEAGGYPHLDIQNHALKKEVLLGYDEEAARVDAAWEATRMEGMDASISVVTTDNPMEMGEVPREKLALYARLVGHPVNRRRREGRVRWCVALYPTPFYALSAGMSLRRFEDYYFDVCCLDYGKMDRAMDALVKRMERADKVHIVGPGTDLTFSIKGLPAIKCAGEANIPDGEVYTAPVRNSVSGRLAYNAPSPHDGFTFENISLAFRDGRIVEATANDTPRINHIFDTDEGARYVGEFSFGLNPYITFPMKDILFDEKIAGSFHFTPGSCYDECDNGNKSAIHWDLVCIQTPEYGGGEIWLDGELIRKDGLFVPESLQCLNPEALR